MLILRFGPIVKRAERPEKARDTVRGARIIKSPVNLLQPLCDANGNSASSCRKWTCLKPQAGALNQRNSDAANSCRIASRNLNRRRNRTLGRSKKIPDISRRLWPASVRLQAQRGRDTFD